MTATKTLVSLLILALVIAGCSRKSKSSALFELVENSGIDFINKVENQKDFNILTYRNFYNGGGVAIGDINNDGLPDVFFTSNMGANKLYLNKGNFQFEDITDKAGIINKGKWGTGVVFVDINGDGWLDLYVCNAGYQTGISNENELYINNHNLTFTESAKQYGLNESGYTTHAAFFDYDGDGDLDCYMLKNSFIPVNTLNYANKREMRSEDWPVADFLKGGGDKLLRNDNGHYTDVSKEAGIYGSLIGFGLGVTVGDVNDDGYPDLYISNDFFEKDYLYINQKNGTFKEELENWMQHISHSSMGADMADINNDGYPDIFTTDMLPGDDYRLKTTTTFENIDVNRLKYTSGFYHQFMQNCLQVNNQSGRFLETAFYSGVAATDWSWGALMFDADNDGLIDIYVCNGIYHDVTDQDFIDFFANDVIQKMVMTGKKGEVDQVISKMPSNPIRNKAFRNLGNLKFADEGENWGFTTASFSNGAAYADLDGDGDLDLIVNNVNEKAFVYKNNSRQKNGNDFLSILLNQGAPNYYAIGAKIKVFQADSIISREVYTGRGFQSSVDYRQVIGIGKKKVDSVQIVWPDKSITTLINPEINKSVTITKQQVNSSVVPVQHHQFTPFFTETAIPFDKHVEDEHVDFYYERNIPVMLSREGPKAAVADVNGDGLEDIFVCGAAGQESQLYIQSATGFKKSAQDLFKRFAPLEDVVATFFDCDNDGDLDLFIGTGGNNSAVLYEYQNRLYINDGKGNFSLSANSLPPSGVNAGAAVAADFDGDGDIDLFVGGRSVPQNYGVKPQSYVLINDGKGNFTDIAERNNKELAFVGMVTAAAYADVTADGRSELVVVGDWMTPRVFSFRNGRFEEVKTNLSNMFGWWRSIAVADLDGDGKDDIVLGNIGENFYLQPQRESDVKLWIADFDKNGTSEKVFTKTINGRDMPVFTKRDMVDQVASLKKQNLKNVDYANKTIQNLFTAEAVGKAEVLEFNYGSSCIAYNRGGGAFDVQKMPLPIQLSSVNAISIADVNGDGKPDVLMGGNTFELLPQFCRLDASLGHVMINNGNAQYTYMPVPKSGVSVTGEVRDIKVIMSHKRRQFIFFRNNDVPVVYQLNEKGK